MITQALRDMKIGFRAGSEEFDGDRPTLVMIHGAGGQARVWQTQTQLLKEEVNTLALDLPGYGESAGRAVDGLDGYAEWLIHLLEEVFPGPVFLMGHSMGGAVVQKAALMEPSLLRGIILVGTGPRLQVAPAFLEGLRNSFEETVDTIIGYAYASGADEMLVREGAKLMKEAGVERVHCDFSACNGFDVRDQVEKIDLPCLILCGVDDKLTPPSLSRKLNQAIKGSRLEIIPSAGHMVMIENYKALNAFVLDFVLGTAQSN